VYMSRPVMADAWRRQIQHVIFPSRYEKRTQRILRRRRLIDGAGALAKDSVIMIPALASSFGLLVNAVIRRLQIFDLPWLMIIPASVSYGGTLARERISPVWMLWDAAWSAGGVRAKPRRLLLYYS